MISPQKALKALGRKPSKNLGQHFLIHQATAEKIVGTINPMPGDVVVEVGAGLGALTLPLSKSGAQVVAIELDRELAEFVRQEISGESSVKVECIDILKFDLVELHHHFRKQIKIIGNLPYNVSSPVLFKLMEVAPCIQQAVLMLQDEVAERVLADPGSKKYGILSVMARYHSERRRVMRVKPTQFHPPPKVDSQVVCFTFRPCTLKPKVEPSWLLHVVRAAFSHRRKTIRNSLLASNLAQLTAETVDTSLKNAAIEPSQRPESLTLEDFLGLAKAIGKTRKLLT
jgi:16S rRNA (adenine1518-N6/adenine1519-N6)-dimethyltransferase